MSNLPEAMACELCGRPDAIRFGDRFVCPECYENAGSCCPEFGGDDLWVFDEEESSREHECSGENREKDFQRGSISP